MPKHRADPRRVLSGPRRYPFTLLFILIFAAAVIASTPLIIHGNEQLVASFVALIPYLLACWLLPRYGRQLDNEQLKPIVEAFYKLSAVFFVGLVLTTLNLSAASASAGVGPGLLMAGLIAVTSWVLFVEMVVKAIIAVRDQSTNP